MSGVVCRIIINGQHLQAQAEAACELATGTYDGVEIMDDAQRDFLAKLMEKQVAELDKFLAQFLT